VWRGGTPSGCARRARSDETRSPEIGREGINLASPDETPQQRGCIVEKESTMKLALSPRPSSGARRGWHVSAGLAAAATAGLLAFTPVANAQQVVVVNQGGDSGGGYRGPDWAVLGSGLLVFGGTYTASLVVAATSTHAGDKGLYAPIVGPWLDIANRCPVTCSGEVGNKVLLGFDGVFQAIGVLSIASSFFWAPSRRGRMAQREDAPSFHLLPASLGRGAPGMMAVGTF
jgi:hypothetical protein